MATLVDKYFSQADLDSIEAAVTKAEASTSGEIAIELASHSRHWNTEALLYALAVSLLSMIAAFYITHDDSWGVYYDTTQALLWGGIGFVVAYFGLGRILKRNERRRQVVWNRALGIFNQITPTLGQTGVLVFVSLEEEQAAIVADKGIASKVPADYWHKPHGMIVTAMKQGKHAEGIVAAVETMAVELAVHFPRASDDINELPDKPKISH